MKILFLQKIIYTPSAKTDNRPEFLQMISDSAKKDFSIVLVHKLDRFARNRSDSIGYRMQLKRHGVSLISVLEYLDSDSPESVILESVLEAMAEYYSLNLSREVRKGLRENALKGIHTGGKPPLGYDVDPITRSLVVNAEESKVVKLIFQRILEGVGYNIIIRELNDLGYRSKIGNKFTKTSLSALLINEKYKGTYVFNRALTWTPDGKRTNKSKDESEILRIDDVVPPIVSKEDFAKVQEIINSRRNTQQGGHNSEEVYLLTGKIICGVCGNKYVGNRKKDGRNKTVQVRYGCNKRHRGTKIACANKEIRREYIEAFVIEKLSQQVFNDSFIPEITDYYNQKIDEANKSDNTQFANLTKNSKELKRKIDTTANLIIESGSATLLSKLHELEAEQERNIELITKLSRRKTEYINKDYVRELFSQGRELLLEKTFPALKKLVQLFVDKVIIYTDRVMYKNCEI